MVARVIDGSEPIEVKQVCCLIYGQPGSKKTSLAQTADNPITLAFDPGIHRAFGRRKAVLFDSWEDVVKFDLSGYSTIVVDTIGMCLDKLAQAIIADNPKNGNKLGGLSLPGFGVLKSRFAAWVTAIRDRGQDLVFTAHEKEGRNGDESYFHPDIVGSSYATIMNVADMVGYLHFEGGKRVLDFAPTDRWMAKVPPCGWGQIILPDFANEPKYLAKLLADAKASMGRVSAESAKVSKDVDAVAEMLGVVGTLEDINALLPTVRELQGAAKKQAGKLIGDKASALGFKFDKSAGVYTNGKPVEAGV